MCHHMMTPSFEQVRAAMDSRSATGRATVLPDASGSLAPREIYPGDEAPVLVPDEKGTLVAVTMTWGFESQRGGRAQLVFNTRLDTALEKHLVQLCRMSPRALAEQRYKKYRQIGL